MAKKTTTPSQELPLAPQPAPQNAIVVVGKELETSLPTEAPLPQRNFTLAELELQYAYILEQIEECEGEITPELEEALKVNEEDRNKKLMGYHYLVRKSENEADMIDREIKRLNVIKENREKRAELLKQHMLRALMLFGNDTGKPGAPLFRLEAQYGDSVIQLSTRRSETVEIVNEDDIPADYWRRPPVPDMKPDKTKIKEALKAGEEVPGAELKTNFSLTIK